MKLPHGQHAIVDLVKLRDYCLNADHPRGKHKARVFAARLGLTQQYADVLRDAVQRAARDSDEAVVGESDRFGQRYVLDFDVVGPAGAGRVRSTWIVRTGEDAPRLTSSYVI